MTPLEIVLLVLLVGVLGLRAYADFAAKRPDPVAPPPPAPVVVSPPAPEPKPARPKIKINFVAGDGLRPLGSVVIDSAARKPSMQYQPRGGRKANFVAYKRAQDGAWIYRRVSVERD